MSLNVIKDFGLPEYQQECDWTKMNPYTVHYRIILGQFIILGGFAICVIIIIIILSLVIIARIIIFNKLMDDISYIHIFCTVLLHSISIIAVIEILDRIRLPQPHSTEFRHGLTSRLPLSGCHSPFLCMLGIVWLTGDSLLWKFDQKNVCISQMFIYSSISICGEACWFYSFFCVFIN